jgi:hypothetical protein
VYIFSIGLPIVRLAVVSLLPLYAGKVHQVPSEGGCFETILYKSKTDEADSRFGVAGTRAEARNSRWLSVSEHF